MKKAIRIFTLAAFWWSVFMLVFYIFLIACVELQWTFINNLPTVLNWIFVNIFINLFRIGIVAVPVLAVGMLATGIAACIREKSVKVLDLPVFGCTTVFSIVATLIGIIDESTLSSFTA